MYKIVPITALTIADAFISSDKIIQISDNGTKMFVGENDYEHKNKFYLSACIENADRSLNSYLSAYNTLSNTYITSALSNVYIENGNLITKETVDKILSSDAFLTKEGCKSFEAECIAYINELKNKAVSIIMAKLNESFIAQNSVKRRIYGQMQNEEPFIYNKGILKEETFPNYTNKVPANSFNFKSGEFTLAGLLFENIASDDDASTVTYGEDAFNDNYVDVFQSYFPYDSFDSAASLIEEKFKDNTYVFNPKDVDNCDFKIEVPIDASFDYKKKESIPIAKLITFVLKNQIYRTLTNICNNYASLMVSIPQPNRTNS